MEHAHRPKVIETSEDHHHDHGSGESDYLHRPKARKRLLWGMTLTGSMMVVEGIGGILTGSLALLSDAGHMLSHFFALGTSFSLDLLALLTAPLAFTFFDWEDENGRLTTDSHVLFAAIKRNAERIAVFYQAAQISP